MDGLHGVGGIAVRADGFGVVPGDHRAAYHHLAGQAPVPEKADGLRHIGGGGGHQGGEAHQGDLMLRRRVGNGLRGHILPQVQDPEAVALQEDLDDVLPDVVDVPLHRGQEDLGTAAGLPRREIFL